MQHSSRSSRSIRTGAASSGSCATRSSGATRSASSPTRTATRDARAPAIPAPRRSGPTVVLRACSPTREVVFDAIKARRCYGVTAAQRIHVELAVNGLPMGAAARAEGPVTIRGRVVGTGPIERVDIFRGLDHIRMLSPYTPASFEGSARYRIAWAGSRVRGRDRLTTWDGHVELSAGRFIDAVTFAMENPEKGIRERSARRICWVSNTTGDDDGIDVTIDAPPGAVLRFRSPVIELAIEL